MLNLSRMMGSLIGISMVSLIHRGKVPFRKMVRSCCMMNKRLV